jgi:hypothetical protein
VPRFFIDILLVLIYMILLISSTYPNWLLPILTIIFILYALWDVLTVYEHRYYYYYKRENEQLPQDTSLSSTYRRGLYSRRSEPAIRRGHIITLLWTLYFIVLLIMWMSCDLTNIYLICAFASAGLVGYRATKASYYTAAGDLKQKGNGTVLYYIVVVCALLVGAYIASLITET